MTMVAGLVMQYLYFEMLWSKSASTRTQYSTKYMGSRASVAIIWYASNFCHSAEKYDTVREA